MVPSAHISNFPTPTSDMRSINQQSRIKKPQSGNNPTPKLHPNSHATATIQNQEKIPHKTPVHHQTPFAPGHHLSSPVTLAKQEVGRTTIAMAPDPPTALGNSEIQNTPPTNTKIHPNLRSHILVVQNGRRGRIQCGSVRVCFE